MKTSSATLVPGTEERTNAVDQPVFWTSVSAGAVLLVALQLRRGRPLLEARSTPLTRKEYLTTATSAAALVFHCATMFFAPWVDVVPGTQSAAVAVRALGTTSQFAYWLPAAALVLSLRRLWWPAVVVLVSSLLGVGATMFTTAMFTTATLTVHLGWLAAAVLTTVVAVTGLTGAGRLRADGTGPHRLAT